MKDPQEGEYVPVADHVVEGVPHHGLTPGKAEGRATVAGTTANVINNCIGAGLLSLPYALRRTSAVWGVVAMVAVAALNHFTLILLARCCELATRLVPRGQDVFTYMSMGRLALGTRAARAVQAIMLCYTLGSCISYMVLIGDFFSHVLVAVAPAIANRVLDICFVTGVGLLPLTLLKDLNKLRFTSAAALVCIFYTTLVIIGHYFAADSVSPTVSTMTMKSGVFAALPICTVAFTLHYNVPRYYKELKDRQVSTFKRATIPAFAFCLVCYVTSALSGYLVFGEETEGNILNNYDDTDISADIARLSLALVIVFTYPLAFHSLRTSVLAFAPAFVKPARPAHYLAVTLSLLLGTMLIGIAVPEVQLVLGINGAVFGSCIVLICPALIYSSLRRQVQLLDEANELQVVSGSPPGRVDPKPDGPVSPRLDGAVLASMADEAPGRDGLLSDFGGDATGGADTDMSRMVLVTPGAAAGLDRMPPYMHAVAFMRTKQGYPYAALAVYGCVLVILGVLVTVGAL